jgi:DNA-directed RNA polymerase subunit RPC12/RpoP
MRCPTCDKEIKSSELNGMACRYCEKIIKEKDIRFSAAKELKPIVEAFQALDEDSLPKTMDDLRGLPTGELIKMSIDLGLDSYGEKEDLVNRIAGELNL